MFSLKNKVIVVTGSNGLLGKAIVDSLKKAEAKVISLDLAFYCQMEEDWIMDITNEDEITRTVFEIVNKYKVIDGWVNNAYPRTSDWGNKLEDIFISSWRENIDMHLNGYFLCCKIVLNEMKKQGFGSLINMSSIYGSLGPDFTVYEGSEMTMPAAYAAIKGGINTLTKYLASYYGPFQVRVNTISPGGIFDNQPSIFVENYCKRLPLRRMANPNDIVSSVHFLLSDESSYITGHDLMVDGGWSII
jgi:NAD(P)-dependent dehydrogenase (short-subunit alcohol dehydrogenase family)